MRRPMRESVLRKYGLAVVLLVTLCFQAFGLAAETPTPEPGRAAFTSAEIVASGVVSQPATATFAVSLTSGPKQKTSPAARFSRDADGVITDGQTGLEWLEGPDRPTDWDQSQAWINGLGNGWRTPTRAELRGIYIADSNRQGRPSQGRGPWPLRLDPAFRLNCAYWTWAEARDASSAWALEFGSGDGMWNIREMTNWNFRGFAVRPGKGAATATVPATSATVLASATELNREPKLPERFSRDAKGVITDAKTGLQWLEGPDCNTSWDAGQTWINSLGNGWRTPTRDELHGIYIATSSRQGDQDAGMPPFQLHLDPAFCLNKSFLVWAEAMNSSTAWLVAFTRGHESQANRTCDDFRCFAVRQPK
ncbi:MAG: DUF1566 domain-containing protein [Candidatus Riflebacteria bacterium]|nr:DUF1566 domain-containing protein [Candidatus Riflebacteria bacterium]